MNAHLQNKNGFSPVWFTLALATGILTATPALALEFEKGDVHATVNSTVSVGVGVRTTSPDPNFIGIANGGKAYSTNNDDGNLAFKKNDIYAQANKITSDLTVTYHEFGVFVRGIYIYDSKLNSKNNFFDRADFAGPPTRTQGPSDFRRKTNDVQDEIGSKGDILDMYFFGHADIGGHNLSYKIGRQSLHWGESTFILNGINSLTAFDANRFTVPGFSVTEIENPSEMVSASIDIVDNVNAELFYQWKWRETITDATGGFFSTNDFVGVGGERVEVGFGRCPENSAPLTCAFASGGSAAPRAADIKGSNSNQYGVALNFVLPKLNDLAISTYAARYNSRLPLVGGHATTVPGVPGTADYTVEYPDDIKLFGVSFNTSLPDNILGGMAIQGEYSLKKDQPLQIDDVELLIAALRVGLPNQIDTQGGRPRNPGEFTSGYIRRDVHQLDLSATKIIGPIPMIHSDQLLLLGEVGLDYVGNMPSQSTLRLEGPGTFLPANATVAAAAGVPRQNGGYATATSWGYRLLARLTYNNVFNRLTLTPSLFYTQDVSGTSPTPILNFVEGRKSLTAGMGIGFLQSWDVELGYTSFFGGGNFNLLQDRDFATFVVKYNF